MKLDKSNAAYNRKRKPAAVATGVLHRIHFIQSKLFIRIVKAFKRIIKDKNKIIREKIIPKNIEF